MKRLLLNPRLFGAVAAFRAERDLRYYLACVHVAPHPHMAGALICAVDGHQLALAYDPTGQVDRPALLKVTTRTVSACLARRAEALELRDGRLCVDVTPRGMKEREEAHVQAGQAIAPDDWLRNFPVYESILPDGLDDLQVCSMGPVNPTLIERLAQTAKRVAPLGYGRFGGAIINYSRRTGTAPIDPYSAPVFTRFECEPNFLTITMPMRADLPQFPLFAAGLAREGRRRTEGKERARIVMPALQRRAANDVNRDAEPLEGMEA